MSVSKPKVVVGVPVYNGVDRLSFALDSLIKQDYKDLEILISNNCSTDGTGEIIEEYCRNYSHITCINQDENIGVIENFKKLVSQAKGDYFMWLAHDDVLKESAISKLVSILDLNEHCNLAIGSWSVHIDPRNVRDKGKDKTLIYGEHNKPEAFDNYSLSFKMLESNDEAYFMCIYGLGRTIYMQALASNFGSTLRMDRLTGVEVALSTQLMSSSDVLLEKHVSPVGQASRFKGDPILSIRSRSRMLYCLTSWYEFIKCLSLSKVIPLHRKFFLPVIFLKYSLFTTFPAVYNLFIPECKDFYARVKAYISRRV